MTPNQTYAEPPDPDPDCVHCGGKGYIETITRYDPPLRFGPDEVCDQSILSLVTVAVLLGGVALPALNWPRRQP